MSSAPGQRSRHRRRGESGWRGLLTRKRLAGAFGAAAAVVAFLVAVTNLTDWIEERFDDPKPPPPPEIDARIHGARLTSMREPLESYLLSTGESLAGLSARERREPGLLFAVRVRLTGSVGEQFPLLWSLHSSRTGARLPGPAYNQLAVTFVPRGRTHARTWPVWVPYPPRKGSYYLRVTLADRKRQPVDVRDSQRFAVARIPQ